MAIQIANPQVVQKIEWLASTMNMGKTAAVEKAIDALSQQWAMGGANRQTDAIHTRALTLLAQLDRIPDRTDSFDPLTWDAQGLPT
jgi:antitoxin VapB